MHFSFGRSHTNDEVKERGAGLSLYHIRVTLSVSLNYDAMLPKPRDRQLSSTREARKLFLYLFENNTLAWSPSRHCLK